MPSSTTKAKREVAAATTAAAIKALSSKPPTLRKKATTPPNKNSKNGGNGKRGTPSKRNAAAVAAEPEPQDDGARSPFTSPSKRARTPQSNRYTEEARRQRNALLLAEDGDDDVGLGRSTRLFAGDDSTTTTTTGRPPLPGKDKEAAEQAGEVAEAPLFKTPQKPKKEGSVSKFGTPSSIQCSPSVKAAYSIVRRCTGSLGGNGAGGAIYGELTTGSMQKVVDIMISHCGLGKDSVFIDVGAGLGKPNIHVAQYPGVAASYGIEHEQVRWQLSLHNLKHLLQAAEEEEEEEEGTASGSSSGSGSAPSSPASAVSSSSSSGSGEENKINHKIFFHYGDITEADTLDPFTHVYMFDIGFPPTLFYGIADRFNRSRCPYLICYHGPRLIAERYGFEVELITQVQTSMHGSSEGHTAYFYKRSKPVPTPKPAKKAAASHCDPLFKAGLDLCKGPREALGAWVRSQMEAQFASPRPARRRRPPTVLFQGDN